MRRELQFHLLVLLIILFCGLFSMQARLFISNSTTHQEQVEEEISRNVCHSLKAFSKEKINGIELADCSYSGSGKFVIINKRGNPFFKQLLEEKLEIKSDDSLDKINVINESIDGYQKAILEAKVPSSFDLLFEHNKYDVIIFLFLFILAGLVIAKLFVAELDFSHRRSVHQIGAYLFDPKNQTLVFNNRIKRITERESQLLKLLCDRKNQIVRRQDILAELWGENDYFTGRSMDVFIARIRKNLSGDKNIKIENIRGVGFSLSDRIKKMEA